MVKLMLFDEDNSWIEIEKGFSIKINYCNIIQQQKLTIKLKKYLDSAENKDDDSSTAYWFDYIYHYVKYHLKDWKGVGKSKSEEIPLKLINDEVDDNIMNALSSNTKVFINIYNAIRDKVSFTEIDKKK